MFLIVHCQLIMRQRWGCKCIRMWYIQVILHNYAGMRG
nr:MAG TPA: hypothetical protein [Caudoviricetes sp.]